MSDLVNINWEKPYNKALCENTHFKLIPSLGNFHPSWFLIVPKDRYTNMGMLDEKELASLEEFIKYLKDVISQAGRYKVVMFEHGAESKESPSSCGVEFAHLHFVVLSESEHKAFFDVVNDCEAIGNYDSIISFLKIHKESYWIVDGEHETVELKVQPNVSQYFRMLLAKSLNIEVFDYKEVAFNRNYTQFQF